MPYRVKFGIFLLAAMAIGWGVGYLSSFVGPWALVAGIAVAAPLTIKAGRKALKRDKL